MDRPRMRVAAPVLDSADPQALARFYERLLGWAIGMDDPTWVTLRSPEDWTGLSFQLEPLYTPPTWPAAPGEQQMMSHLDIAVADLEEGVAWAIDAGAALAGHQPQDDVRVMLDPDGHPFCLFPWSFEDS